MNSKKTLYVGALVGAIGIGAMISPIVSLASTDQVVPQFQGQQAGMGARMGQYFAGSMQGVVAETIGITADELYELRTSEKSIEQIANDKGYTTEQLLDVLVAAKVEQVEQLVKDGVITEEQKAYILDRMEENMKTAITRTEVGPKYGQGKGMRGQGIQTNGEFQPVQGKVFGGGGRWSDNN